MVENTEKVRETGAVQVGPLLSALPHPLSTFRGRGDYVIDDKNRLTLPMPLRRPLAEGGQMAALDATVNIWPEVAVREMVDLLYARVRSQELDLMQVKLFIASLVEVRLDTQGRIVVPESLRAEAGLDRAVSVCGVGPHIELWPEGRFEAEALARNDSVSEELVRAGF